MIAIWIKANARIGFEPKRAQRWKQKTAPSSIINRKQNECHHLKASVACCAFYNPIRSSGAAGSHGRHPNRYRRSTLAIPMVTLGFC